MTGGGTNLVANSKVATAERAMPARRHGPLRSGRGSVGAAATVWVRQTQSKWGGARVVRCCKTVGRESARDDNTRTDPGGAPLHMR